MAGVGEAGLLLCHTQTYIELNRNCTTQTKHRAALSSLMPSCQTPPHVWHRETKCWRLPLNPGRLRNSVWVTLDGEAPQLMVSFTPDAKRQTPCSFHFNACAVSVERVREGQRERSLVERT